MEVKIKKELFDKIVAILMELPAKNVYGLLNEIKASAITEQTKE